MFDWKETVPIVRLLFHVPSRKFLSDEGRWTDNPEEAIEFPDLTSVAERCNNLGLKGLQLVLKDDHKMFKIPLPTLCMLVR